MACPTLTRSFPTPNPVTYMSREALTNQSGAKTLKIPKSDLNPYNYPLCLSRTINLSLKSPSSTISVTWSHHHHQPSLKIFNHFKAPDQMEANSSTSSSLRRRAPLRCYYAKKTSVSCFMDSRQPWQKVLWLSKLLVFQFEYFVLLGFIFSFKFFFGGGSLFFNFLVFHY